MGLNGGGKQPVGRCLLPARLNEQLEANLRLSAAGRLCPGARFYFVDGRRRDGNPNVTADITRHVLLLSRWKAS